MRIEKQTAVATRQIANKDKELRCFLAQVATNGNAGGVVGFEYHVNAIAVLRAEDQPLWKHEPWRPEIVDKLLLV